MTVADRVALSEETSAAIQDSYHQLIHSGGVWERTFWRGFVVSKLPSDLFIYQELIHSLRPDYLIETGTHMGGSALFFADMMELNGHGKVISIDTVFRPDRPEHPRIQYITDDSIHAAATLKVKGKVIVSLDSNHSREHVLRELDAYAPLATEYLVVEDTNINHPVAVSGYEHGGPMEAMNEFLQNHPEFAPDMGAHKFLVTFNPNGWLRRV
jgi:cephalosporin hydroxylase